MALKGLVDKLGVHLGWWPTVAEREKKAKRREVERSLATGRLQLKKLKGIHLGRRGFVIGNGPSLRIADLDRLQDEVCIASNKIHMAFSDTEWRPSFYTIVDDKVWAQTASGLHEHVTRVFIPDYLPITVNTKVEIVMFRSLPLAATHEDQSELPFSDDAGAGLHGGNTVTYENIQLAMHLGLDPIYLIGCDHFYGGTVGVEGGSPVQADEARNHFLPNYAAPGEVMNPALVSRMTRSYQWAKAYADRHGRSIINATRGGYLEVFPRKDLDELIG